LCDILDGSIALILAAEKGYLEVCRLLLEHGANVEEKEDNVRVIKINSE
jgi:ankyrin repeat protein